MSETVKTVKKPTKSRFSYTPKNEEEKQHLEVLESLLEDKRRGDWALVAEIVGISSMSAEKAFFRVFQKHHFEVVDALKKVIDKRKELLLK
jgi:hypothetical protein